VGSLLGTLLDPAVLPEVVQPGTAEHGTKCSMLTVSLRQCLHAQLKRISSNSMFSLQYVSVRLCSATAASVCTLVAMHRQHKLQQ
jgi:hypothetical protein